MQNLFSYPIIVDDLTGAEKKYTIKANIDDLVYLKEVLKVSSVKSCSAEIFLHLDHKAHSLKVSGVVSADLELQSVVSLENFIRKHEGEFELHYDTKATYKDIREMEANLEDEVPDVIVDGQIDLGEVVIEQVALLIEDHPRKDGEKFEFRSEFDEETTVAQNPFNILKNLKK